MVDPSRELAEALVEYASWSNEFLLTVYHHSFKDRRVVGYAGEGRNFTTAHPDRKTDWFECPACGAPNTPGSLLCLEPRCLAVYSFEHEDQIFSPIARRVYEIQAETIKQEFDVQEDAPDWGGDEEEQVEAPPTEEVKEVDEVKAAEVPKTKWATRGKRGVFATIMEMAVAHCGHAEKWFNFTNPKERQDSAARGCHPFFQGEGVCNRWSGFGDPPALDNSAWVHMVELRRNDQEDELTHDWFRRS